MIPRLIHQTAKTKEIPENWQVFQRKLIELHPGWTYKLWTDEDNYDFVKKEFPDFYPIFIGFPKNIMRADVIRYLLMYRLGGLYMDLDYEMLKPFDLLDHDIVLPWESEGDRGEGFDLIANSLFASAPGHPFWKAVLDSIAKDSPYNAEADVEKNTGPGRISKVFFELRKQGMQFYNPPRMWFNPPTPRGPREYRNTVNNGVSYGIHHCNGTWRTYGIATKCKMLVSRMIFGTFK